MKTKLGKILKKGKSSVKRGTALIIIFSLLFQIGFPYHAFALTGGPSQPEVQSFEPIGTSEMVDPFSGGFTYNIPLLNVDGYPINISYHSGITMDQEASWVGLGWNINPGVINRNVRGIPDDFEGDLIERDFHMKDNTTWGASVGLGGELFGDGSVFSGGLDFSLGIHYNNYTGVGADISLNTSISVGLPGKTSLTAGLGITASTDDGTTIAPSIGLSIAISTSDNTAVNLGLHVGTSFNSRQGLQNLTIGTSLSASSTEQGKGAHLHKNGTPVSDNIGGPSEMPSAKFNLMLPTYTPQVTMPMANTSITGSIKLGVEGEGYSASGNVSAWYSSQTLAQTTIYNPAFGYLHANEGEFNSNAMMDFNREKDGPFTSSTPDLPLANFTYDILSVSGQGVGGSYRPFRSDVGHVFDPYCANTTNGTSVGAEVSIGALWHAGIDVTLDNVNSYSGDWTTDNQSVSGLSFRQTPVTDPLYEPVYFKEANEKSLESDPGFFQSMGAFDAQRVELDQLANFYTVADSTYESGLPVTSTNYRQSRDIRNQNISFLTRSQLDTFALQNPAAENLYSNAPGHHIAEITSLGTDGKRYVYGIAAYNTDKEEVTFNCSGRGLTNGYVNYNPGDNSTNNNLGRDQYYSNVKTPPYAHSYLLTAVLSPDYVDADSIRGPSDGDLGTWTKFNYAKYSYNWRTPVGQNLASYNEGLKSDTDDDKANYIFGNKEIWYLQSIETKNYIAVFQTEPRQDGKGVQDKNGAIDPTQSMMLLNSISLYTKPNYNAHQANTSIPLVPIEVVHFVYDYELCPYVPNNINTIASQPNNGKLTLKQIYFTYQNSYKGALSPYNFQYNGLNPSYDIRAYDRWGFYKPFTGSTDPTTAGAVPSEYPYVCQDKSVEDANSSAWNLTDIGLPSGGSIHVDYESNDYNYVQDKPAMQMDTICSYVQSIPQLTSGSLARMGDSVTFNYPLTFKLQTDASGAPINNMAAYFSGISNLYFRFLVEITPGNFEYVSGYAPIASYGVCSGDPSYGWVMLQGVGLNSNGSGSYSPIIKSAIQYGRINTPSLVWNEPTISDGMDLLSVLSALTSAISQLGTLTEGTNGYIYDNGDCQNFVIGKSWIRVNTLTGRKLGDGARVKDIEMNDNWNGMTGGAETSFDYGQQYSYTLSDGITSSGVASYEPQLGGDENPWRQPVFYDEAHLLIPDDKHYMEEPFGESFFPSPSVGYSLVTVKNLQRSGVHRNATGYVVHEFYTSKDFPTITSRTDLQEIEEKTDPLSLTSIFNVNTKDYMTASQGYVIETNDMNGKPEAQYVYQEDQTVPISSVQYYYQRDPYNNAWRVNNTAKVINKNGGVSSGNIGVFFDDVADFRNSETDNVSSTTQLNVDCIYIIVPIPIPMIWPSSTDETTRFRSNVMTKVIQRFGLLDSTVATDLGSRVKTQNLAYDAQTGEVLVTQTANDYNDPIYNMTYPAYWYYDGMGPAYQNIDVSYSNVSFNSSGVANISGANRYFVPGDELALSDPSSGYSIARCWVISATSNKITAELKNGSSVNAGSYNIQVIRSGRRNQQTMDMEKLTSMVNPLNGLSSNAYQKITQASAKVYAQNWTTYCNCFDAPSMVTKNPYVLGIAGNYRLKTSFLYLTTRGQSNFDNNTNTRQDGTYNSYTPFYSRIGGGWRMTPDNWTYTSSVTQFNPYGQEIEDVDALGRFSSATFGYNQTLPTAVAANSMYQEMGFDGFEDYSFGGCADNHLDINRSAVRLDATQSHTGRHSLVVDYKDTVKIGGSLTTCPVPNPCALSACWNAEDLKSSYDFYFEPQSGTAPYSYNYDITSGNSYLQSIYIDSNGYLNIIMSNVGGASISGNVTITDANGCTFQFSFNTYYNAPLGVYELDSNPQINECLQDY